MLDRPISGQSRVVLFAVMVDAAMSPPSEGEVKMEIDQADSRPALTPPTSENTDKKNDESGSELSDLEPEEPLEDIPNPLNMNDQEEIVPDHYYEDGKVPVFKPVSLLGAPQKFNMLHVTGVYCLFHHTDMFLDHESVSQFQRIHPENRQVWHEVRHCQSDPS